MFSIILICVGLLYLRPLILLYHNTSLRFMGVWGYIPPENFGISDACRWILGSLETKISVSVNKVSCPAKLIYYVLLRWWRKVSQLYDCRVLRQFLTRFNLLNACLAQVLETGKQHKRDYKTGSLEIIENLHCWKYILTHFVLTHTKSWGVWTLGHLGIYASCN